MSARLVWVLLLLAAVFSMHGVECVAADAGAGHGMATSAHAMAEGAARAQSAGSTLAAAGGHQVPGASAFAALLDRTSAASQDRSPVHGDTFWAVCLAVLMTAVMSLGTAALARRALAVVRARAPSPLWHTGWFRLPRPPDLSALCLLRI